MAPKVNLELIRNLDPRLNIARKYHDFEKI